MFKKRGAACLPTNYLPLSLLSVTAKVLEAVVYEQLYEHVDWILADSQSGFRHNDGPVLHMVRIVHNLTKAIDLGQTTVACFYDLSKAFDRVWHDGLIKKTGSIRAYRICVGVV